MSVSEKSLYIGVKNDLSPFEVDLKALTRGLVVVGQSGCGKSFLLGRIVEEIIRHTEKSRILIIDPNSDFCEGVVLKAEEEFQGKLDLYKSGLLEKEYKDFEKRELKIFKNPFGERDKRKWADAQVFGFLHNQERYNLSWYILEDYYKMRILTGNKLDSKMERARMALRGLIELKTKEYFKKYQNREEITQEENDEISSMMSIAGWQKLAIETFVEKSMQKQKIIKEEEKTSQQLMEEFKQDPNKMLKWIQDLLSKFNKDKVVPLNPEQLHALLDTDTIWNFIHTLVSIKHKGLWREKENINVEMKNCIGIPEKLFSESSINIIDIGFIEIKLLKQIITYYVLNYLFLEHMKYTAIYKQNKINGDTEKPEYKDPRKPTFILIDEAHNFAPEGSSDPHEQMLGELIHTIAAEGRKYGLHLILATQRPHKVKRGLLGECDNAIIMKMNSRQDLELLSKQMRILDEKLLEPCLHFQGQGNALAVGEMTKMAPYTQIFKSAPRRTKEGGVDIPFF